MNRGVFLDRDGILNVDVGYTFRVEDLEVPAGVPESLARLAQNGFKLVVVTNQSGVARGKFTLDDVRLFHEALSRAIRDAGGPPFDLIQTCPHHPGGSVAPFNVDCTCRKPATGLIENACRTLNLDIARSFMIGDKWTDVLCGARAGARSFLVQDPKSLTYELPSDVRFSRAEGQPFTAIADSPETGPVEVYSSLSGVSSRILGLAP